MTFTNNKIELEDLPSVEASQYDHLESGFRKVIWVENFIMSAVILTGMTVFYFFDGFDFLKPYSFLPFVGAILLLSFLTWVRLKSFSRKGYQLRQHDIIYKSGIWWQEEVAVPFVRVQHSEITQGPIGRWVGFATLKLYTAGGSRSDLAIPALHLEEAEKLKAFIGQKTNDEADPII